MLVLVALSMLRVSLLSCEERIAVVIELTGMIDLGKADLVERTLRSAAESGAEAVVLLVDTDGGILDPTRRIVNSIVGSGMLTIGYVPPQGRALSAGAYILLSTKYAAMAPDTIVGACEPRPPDPKVVNAMEKWMESIANARGRNRTALSLMVKENLVMTSEEAAKSGVIDLVASDTHELLKALNITVDRILYIRPDAKSTLLSLVGNPITAWILTVLGGLILLVGLTHPTFIGEGVGLTLILLGIYGLGIVSGGVVPALLALIGVITMLFELKTGHGINALVGVGLACLGLLLLYSGQPLLKPRSSLVAVSLLSFFFAGVVGFYMHKIRQVLLKKEKLLDYKAQLLGKEGEVREDIEPYKTGVVLVEAELWSAKAKRPVTIRSGERVRVVGVEGLTLIVEKVQ